MAKSDQVYKRYSDSLLSIVRREALYSGDIDKAFYEITEAAANTLNIERSSIWLYADNQTKIRCSDLYERGPDRHSEGAELTSADYPAYFAAMNENRAIDAHDARRDPRTREFSQSYLTPLGITSMLDAPIHFDGQTIGVICQEHIGQVRRWTPEEITYAGSLADLISHALVARDRKQAEEALKESEELFRSVIDNSPSFINLKDADGQFQLVNRKNVEMLGLEPPDIVGKSSLDLFPKKAAEEATAHHRKVLETKSAITEERQTFIKQGTRDFLITKFPVLDESGAIKGIGTIGTDITERKKAEEAKEKLSQAVENVPVGILLFDSDDRLVFFNKRYAELMEVMADILKPGVTFEEIVRTIVDRQPNKDAQGREEEFIRERVEQHRNPTGPIDIRREDMWLTVDETRLPDGSTFTIITDITDLKQAEEDRRKALAEAEQATRSKSEFLAAMSHDLRTPLNAIIGFADILYNQYLGPPGQGKYREYAGDIKASGEHLLELVNDILDISTIEAGKQSLVKEKLSALEIVTECERIVENKARSNGIDLVTKVPKDLPPLYADRRASKQILLNLLSNAIKFTPQGGRITVSAKASQRSTTLKIADTGKGIPAEKLPKLTDPFIRGEHDPYLSEDGWGLGLTITKSLVELHGGTLDIKSKVGKGTTVTVTLPNSAP